MIFSIIDMKSYEFEEPYSMNNYSWLNLLSIQLFKTAFSPFSQQQELIFIFGLIGSKMNWLPLSQSSPRAARRALTTASRGPLAEVWPIMPKSSHFWVLFLSVLTLVEFRLRFYTMAKI